MAYSYSLEGTRQSRGLSSCRSSVAKGREGFEDRGDPSIKGGKYANLAPGHVQRKVWRDHNDKSDTLNWRLAIAGQS